MIMVQITNDITLSMFNVLRGWFVRCLIPMTRKTTCAIRKGIVSISLKTPTNTHSIL